MTNYKTRPRHNDRYAPRYRAPAANDNVAPLLTLERARADGSTPERLLAVANRIEPNGRRVEAANLRAVADMLEHEQGRAG